MLRTTICEDATVTVTVKKTGKKYYRTMRYGKRIIEGQVRGPKMTRFFLREGRSWKEVSEAEYKEATSEEAVKKIHQRIGLELRERVEREMKVKIE